MSGFGKRLLEYVRHRASTGGAQIGNIVNKKPYCPRPLPENLAVFSVRQENASKYWLVFTSNPASAFKNGITGESIIGELDSSLSITPGHFHRNSVFKDVLHQVIAEITPELLEAQEQARNTGEGWLYVIDARADDPQGEVPPEDIFGRFCVEHGEIIRGSYQMNPNHLFVTDRGLFRLDPKVHAALLARLRT